MAEFDAVFFDIDGTLLAGGPLMHEAFREAFADQGLTIESKHTG